MLPRTYIVLQRSRSRHDEKPDLIAEFDKLTDAQKKLLNTIEGKPGQWLAKNGRAGHYYDKENDDIVRVWIKRKRSLM